MNDGATKRCWVMEENVVARVGTGVEAGAEDAGGLFVFEKMGW